MLKIQIIENLNVYYCQIEHVNARAPGCAITGWNILCRCCEPPLKTILQIKCSNKTSSSAAWCLM